MRMWSGVVSCIACLEHLPQHLKRSNRSAVNGLCECGNHQLSGIGVGRLLKASKLSLALRTYNLKMKANIPEFGSCVMAICGIYM